MNIINSSKPRVLFQKLNISPLNEHFPETELTYFLQVFVMSDGSSVFFPWSKPITIPGTSDANFDMTSEELVGIIVGVTAMIVALAFIIICCFNWKYSLR